MVQGYDDLDFPGARPFWFVSAELLSSIWHAEIRVIIKFFAQYTNLRALFDDPEATIPQRTTCFELLAHRKVIEIIDEVFVGRYENSPALSDAESNALRLSQDLVPGDAPAWVLEVNQVVELLPSRLYCALPEALRNEVAFITDPAKGEAVRSARDTLSGVDRIQALTARVFEEQLQRLRERWSTEIARTEIVRTEIVRTPQPNKQKGLRKRDAQRIKREELIAEIAGVTRTQVEFLQTMDNRRVQPQPTWDWPGSWTQAYKDPHLRKLIHQDKSRAVSRVRARRGR